MNHRIDNLVAGIADVADPDPYLRPAIALAESVGAMLHLVHAFHPPGQILSAVVAEDVERVRNDMESRLRARAKEAGAKDRFACHVAAGSTADVILDVAQQANADLVMVGATRRGQLAGSVVGTTAQRVLRASAVPVLVQRDPEHGIPRRILFTTDLSELSEGVHRRGLDLVAGLWPDRHPEFRSLFVAGDDVLLPPPVHQLALRAKAEERLIEFLAKVVPAQTSIEPTVRLGTSAGEILAEAQDWNADLLVLGTHGRRGISRFLIGSVAEKATLRAPCNVLLISTAALSPAGDHEDRLA